VAKMNSLVERVRKMLDDVGRERGRRLVLACAFRQIMAARRRRRRQQEDSVATCRAG